MLNWFYTFYLSRLRKGKNNLNKQALRFYVCFPIFYLILHKTCDVVLKVSLTILLSAIRFYLYHVHTRHKFLWRNFKKKIVIENLNFVYQLSFLTEVIHKIFWLNHAFLIKNYVQCEPTFSSWHFAFCLFIKSESSHTHTVTFAHSCVPHTS